MKAFCIIALLFIISCSDTVKNFDLYTHTVIDKVDPFPTASELKQKLRIVIVTDDQTGVQFAGFNQQQIAISTLDTILSEKKSIQILDRGIIKNIKEELILSLFNNNENQNNSINKESDYIFLIKMDSLIFSGTYDDNTAKKLTYSALEAGVSIAPLFIPNKGLIINFRNGGQSPISGEFDYTTSFSGSIIIIKTSTGEQIAKIPISHTEEKNEDAAQGMRQKTYDPILIKNTIFSAIKNATKEINKYLPAIGFISKRYDHLPSEPSLFQITLGSNFGVSIGDIVYLERKIYDENPLTNEKITSIRKIEIGTIIKNDYKEAFSWVKVDDKNIASTIKIGEKVTVNLK